MKNRLFLIHWNRKETEEYFRTLKKAGLKVKTEAEDGARACKQTKTNPPDAFVIYLTKLPSHGREIAH